MRRACIAASLGVLFPFAAGAQTGYPDSFRIRRDVALLASDEWEGRLTCTSGNNSAVEFIAARFDSLGLTPLPESPGNNRRKQFLDEFSTAPEGRRLGGPVPCRSRNVVGLIRGTDPVLAKEFIVIGAHLDHIGYETRLAKDPREGRVIHNGADDNASGTAGLLELARLFAASPPKRSLVFAAFNAEEIGLIGSQHFVASRLTFGRVHAMVNLDMIGRLHGDSLFIVGAESAAEFRPLVENNNTDLPFHLRFTTFDDRSSDHASFSAAGIPALHFFTGYHDDYHAATDDVSRVDVAGVARVTDFAARFVQRIADRPEPLTTLIRSRGSAPRENR